MAKLDLSQAEFLFHRDGLSGATLQVHQFSGRESLSRPFEFQIDLVCDDSNLDLEAPIGLPACLTLRGRLFDGSRYSRYVHGVIERFVQIGAGIRHSRYQVTLVPTIKPLAFTRNSRIFQRQSGPDVTQKVLQEDKVPGDWVNTVLHGSYGARDYCVQYQESDLDFIQRLWEEEGIFYFFEHEQDKDKVILGDGGYAFSELPAYSGTQLRDKPHLYEECLFESRAETALRPGATVLRDFKFKQPTLDLEATAQAGKFVDYKMYFFPGEYVDPALGQQYAKLRLEELQCRKKRYIGTGTIRAMLPGYKFSLSGHRRGDCNQEYLIISVEHRGTQPGALGEEGAAKQEASYQNRVECIPAKVPFRPARETARPSIPGIQTAVVVGPPGEEIHCDEHGRVKVQFHWDRQGQRDDNSSCWIRVSQPWGGAGQGGMFIPRVGQEVIIHFLEGDPDRPVIVGRVYNGENGVPHGLPAGKNISTIRSASTPGGGGFNELRFDDSAGGEQVFFHAQKDQNQVIGNNHDTQVGVDQSLSVGSNQSSSIGADQSLGVGSNQSSSIGVDQSLSVGSNQSNTIGSNQSTQVGSNQSLTVGANQDTSIGANQTLSVAVNQTVSVGSNQTISVGANETIRVTADSTRAVTGNRKVSVTGNRTESITGNAEQSIQGNKSVAVTGNSTEGVKGSREVSVTGAQTHSIKGAVKLASSSSITYSADANMTLAASGNAVLGADGILDLVGQGKATLSSPGEVDVGAPLIKITADGAIELSVGGSSIKIHGGGVDICGPQIKLN